MARADFDDLNDEVPRRHSRSGFSTTGLVLVGALVAAGVIIRKVLQQAHSAQQIKTTEGRRDKILKDTFPASDPPASQYFDIPVNRQ